MSFLHCDENIYHIRGKMYNLFKEYVRVRSNSSNASMSQLVPPIEQDFNIEENQ